MTDNSQEPQRRKRRLIAPLVIALGVALILIFAALTRTGPPAPTPPPEVVVPARPPLIEAPPAPPPPATRGDIIDRARLAADAYNRANAPAPAKDALVKRAFRIRLPFGCSGPSVEPGAAQAWYQIDAAKRTVRLTARPAVWTSLPLVQSLEGGGEIEAVEGFWITRPWSRSEACAPRGEQAAKSSAAAAPTVSPPAAPAVETLGLARIFSQEESRVVRRNGRPYELVRKLPDTADLAAPRTYSLVLEGRIVGFADGQAIRCWSPSADQRPVCLLAVEFDRVAFEDAAGEVLAEWDN